MYICSVYLFIYTDDGVSVVSSGDVLDIKPSRVFWGIHREAKGL